MPPIRNSCVARGVVTASGYTTVYTVPASTVLLLKSIITYNSNAAAQYMHIHLKDAGDIVELEWQVPNVASNTSYSWSGWVALNAGDQLIVGVTAGPFDYWVSGALLPFVPGF